MQMAVWQYNKKKKRYLLQSTHARALNIIMFQDFVVREQSSRFPSYLYTVYTLNMLEDTNGNLNDLTKFPFSNIK